MTVFAGNGRRPTTGSALGNDPDSKSGAATESALHPRTRSSNLAVRLAEIESDLHVATAVPVVACVSIVPSSTQTALDGTAGLWESVSRCVRAADRACPVSRDKVVICFGPDVAIIEPRVLGKRLASASMATLGIDGSSPVRQVVVAVTTQEGGADLTALGSRAVRLSSAAAKFALTRHPLASGLVLTQELPPPHARSGPSVTPRSFARRTLVTLSRRGRETSRLSSLSGTVTQGDTALFSVLIVDPSATEPGLVTVAAQVAASVVEGMDLSYTVAPVTDEDSPVNPLGLPTDAVVLVLHSGVPARTRTRGSPWSPGERWHLASRITAAFTSAGAAVLAVDAGAGAAALAGCVAQGATGLFDMEELATELQALRAAADNGVPVRDLNRSSGRFSDSFEALLRLTPSERRVLFHLTEGMCAPDIAAHLIVSVTTVRSHIRSILRKLNVKSQLAAVAIANGCERGRVHAGLNSAL